MRLRDGRGGREARMEDMREHAWLFAAFVWWSFGQPASPRPGHEREPRARDLTGENDTNRPAVAHPAHCLQHQTNEH